MYPLLLGAKSGALLINNSSSLPQAGKNRALGSMTPSIDPEARGARIMLTRPRVRGHVRPDEANDAQRQLGGPFFTAR